MVDISEFKAMEVFSVLSPGQLEQVAAIAEKITCKVNSHFYRTGDHANYLFVLSKGLISLRESNSGQERGISFQVSERGGLFGAACFMNPQQYTITGVCLEDSEVLAIDADQLQELCRTDADLDYKLIKAVARLYFERYQVAKNQLLGTTKTSMMATMLLGTECELGATQAAGCVGAT